MVFVFICLDGIAPAQPIQASGENGLRLMPHADARPDRMAMLATCIDKFDGAYPVLASRQMMGRRLEDVQDSLGCLQTRIRDSVNTTGESAYELVSDFMVACDFMISRSFEWVAIADTRESFPPALWHRVAKFSGEATDFEASCCELERLIASTGSAAFTAPTPQELSILLSNLRMVGALRKHVSRTRTSSR
jgi:hypothetical protein